MNESQTNTAKRRPSFILSPAMLGSGFMVAGLLATGAVLFWFDPTQHSFYPQCLFHRLTGWNCPGCGTMRAGYALLHGHLLVALRDNALFVGALPVVGFHSFRHTAAWAAGRPLPLPKVRPVMLAAIMIGLLVFMVVRNIPVAPFTLLSPAQ